MSTAPQIQFFGGIGTIGGTKVIVRESGFGVLFDFGMAYAPGGDFWGGRLQPRPGAAALRDLTALGDLPSLGGIYRPAHVAPLGLRAGWDGRTQVFISHLHLDHMALLHLLADEVPVWMHADSLRLLWAVADSGEPPAVPAGARAFAWGEPIQVGPMTVTPVGVDHDVLGQGLRKAIYNYMHGLCVEDDVRRWFEHLPQPVPRSTVKRGKIGRALSQRG